MGNIADVYQARGQLDEALRIRREEQLPVYEALGDVRSLLVAWTNIALLLLRRRRAEDESTATMLLARAFRAAHQHGFGPERGPIVEIMTGLGLPSPHDDPAAFDALVERLEHAASPSTEPSDPEDA